MQPILTLSQWETRILDVFSSSCILKSTQDEHLNRIARVIYNEASRKHGKRAVYPVYVQGFITGFSRACDSKMMRDNIEFCYIVDGILYSVRDDSSHLTTRHYCDKVNPENGSALLCRDDTARGLFWRDSDKRFF